MHDLLLIIWLWESKKIFNLCPKVSRSEISQITHIH